MLMSVNVWGTDVTFGSDWNSLFGTSYSGTISGVKANSLTLEGTVSNVSFVVTNGTSTNGYVKTSDFRAYNGYTITITAPTNNNITAISSTKGGKNFSSGVSANVGTLSISNNAISWSGSSNSVVLSCSGTVSFATITVTYSGGDDSEPSLSVSPTTIDFGVVAVGGSVDAQDVTATLTNTDYALATLSGTNADAFEITAGEELTETGTITVQPKATTLAVEGTYSATLEVEAEGVDDAKTVTLLLKVAAPTGTFEKFTEDLEEGDYVICSGTIALKNELASNTNYIGYETVTISADKITNPSEALVWHIAQSGDYWTLYNAVVEKYAASTGAKNKGQVIADGTDDKALWTTSESYEFVNKANAASSVNANLRYNSGYGFACYGTGTGSALTLYKKSNGLETVATPTFSPAAGLYEAEQDITISCTTAGASIYYTTDGAVPSTSSTLYTGTFKLAENKTIKAIAVKEGMNNSSVASATYTFALPYTSLAEFVSAAPTTESALVLDAADGVVIIGATSKNLYVQDAAGTTMILYNASAAPAWTAGKRIEGKLTGTFTTYQGMNEMVLATWNNANANNDGTMPEPAVLTELTESTFATNFGKYIKMEGQYFQSTGLSSNAVDTKNAGQTITSKMYNTFGVMTGKTLPSMDDATVVEGVFIKYYSDYELAVTSIAAGDAKIDVDPVGGADAVNAVALAMNAQVTVTPVAGFATKLNGNPITEATTITIDDAKSITVVSNRDFYTEKSVTYFYKVDESAKAVIVNQPEVGGTIAANPVSGVAGDIITLTYEAAAHYNFGSFYVMAGETPVTVSENAGVYTFEMPNANVTVSATFNIMSQYTATFVAGAQTATGSVDPIARYMDELEFQLPANGFSYAGHVFAGWSDGSTVKQPGENYTLAGDKEFTATWEELPIWAYTYTSNVEISADASQKVTWEEVSYDCVKTNKGASATIKVPANTTELHFHIAAWKGEGQTVTIKKGETTLTTIGVTADAGVANNSPYTLQNAPATTDYFSVALSDIAEETTITIAGASGKRFVLFGVNAIQPAAITIDPASKDFGEVKQGFDAEQVFTLTPNAFATGTITAEIDGEGFSASAVEDNKVTVTFAPTEITEYNATLIIKHDGTQMCTAALSGKGIAATTPEIAVSTDEIDFSKVKQDATVADQAVTVTLSYLDAATASIDDDTYFSIDKTDLVAGENTITISAKATASGTKNATITITGTGATTKTIAVKMDVTSKWAGEYTSNVKVESDKVIIAEEEYEAVKAGTGKVAGSTTITVPEGAYALHFHAAGWNNEDVTLSVKNGDTELGPFDLYKDAGVTGNSPFTLQGENYDTDQYFYVEFDALEEETTFTFAATSGNRFVLYGVNQEGGIVPELDHLTITGSATHTEYEVDETFDPAGLTVNAIYTLAGVEQDPIDVTEDVEWEFTPATLTAGSYDVTVKATYEDKEVSTTVAVEVTAATPEITVDATEVGFGTVLKDDVVDAKTVAVTLKAIAEATVEVSGEGASAFNVTPASLTESGNITITPVTTAAGEFTATITISADGAESKTISVTMNVTDGNLPKEKVDFTEVYSDVTGSSSVDFASYSGVTFSLTADKNDGNQPKYYANGSSVRAYAKNTITISSEKTIAFILINYTSAKGQDDKAEVSAGNLIVNEKYGMWTLGAKEGTLTVGATCSFDNITVYYEYDEVVRSAQSENQIGTGCQTLDIVAVKGATLYQVNYTTGSYLEFKEVTYPVKAGMPIIMQADGTNDGKIEVIYGQKSPVATEGIYNNNGLYGYIGAGTHKIPNDEYYYVFKGGMLRPALDNYATNGRAYIKLDEVPTTDQTVGSPAPRRRMSVGIERSMPTGFETIMMQKGLNKVIMNNQLFLIRDGKLFNAQGALVK